MNCPYCSSSDTTVPNTYGWSKCNVEACARYFENTAHDATALALRRSTTIRHYNPCPTCRCDVYTNEHEATAGQVWCARCKTHFPITKITIPTIEKETTTTMSATSSTAYSGECHVLLRIKGPADRIDMFHQLIKKVDGDWPFHGRTMVRVCKVCAGVLWNAPRIGPADLKAAARQVGALKVKIKHFATMKACRGTSASYNYSANVIHLSEAKAHDLYRSNGVTAFRAEHCLTPTVVPAIVTAIPTPIGPISEEQLIGEVLADPTPSAPLPPLGSAVQHPHPDNWEGMESMDGVWLQ